MSEIYDSLSPKELIAAVRAQYRIDDPSTEMLRGQLNNALRLLSEDLYSDDTHFVAELIQNADDNHYSEGIVPKLEFHSRGSRLVIVNNEAGFKAENVLSLCRTGESTKKADKAKYTGEKGIGFKSVFTVSDAPEIHSNGYHFRFDRTDKTKLLGFVVPEWVDKNSDAVKGHTTIVLPAPANTQFDNSKLQGLDPKLLLFLRKLRHIEISEPNHLRSFVREDRKGVSVLTVSKRNSSGASEIWSRRYVRTTFNVDMQDIAEDKRPGIATTEIVLAFPVTDSYVAAPDFEGSSVYAFLPIRQAGFRFSIQADFVLSASRGEIKEQLDWNIRLRDKIANAFVSSLDEFKRNEALSNSCLEFIPRNDELLGEYFRLVRKAIVDKLIETKCLLSESGDWSLPKDLRVSSKKFREIFPSKIAKELFGYDYIHADQQVSEEVIEALNIKGASVEDVLLVFTNHRDWFIEQPIDWKKCFYSFIADSPEKFIKAGLLDIPFLPLDNGEMIAPAGKIVYFPLGKARKYGFEQDLQIVDIQLFDYDENRREKTQNFLSAVGVQTDEPYQLIVGHILPKHVSGDWKRVGQKSLLGHLRYIKDKFESYLVGASLKGQNELLVIKELKEKLYIGTKEHRDGSWIFNRAEYLYLSDAYLPAFPIEKYLEGKLKPTSFVSEEYLPANSKNPSEVAGGWRSFFSRLGINDAPKVSATGRDWTCSPELTVLLQASEKKIRLDTLLCISRNWEMYSDKLEATAYSRNRLVSQDSTFIRDLRFTVVSTNRKINTSLNQAYYPSEEIKTLMGNSVSYVDAGICQPMLIACHVSYLLDAKVLIKRLQQLKDDENSDTSKALQKIYSRIEDIFDTDREFIYKSFSEQALIRVKGPHKSWRRPNEVCWESSGEFLDSICPPLSGQYRDFSKFFERLGVKREIPVEKRIDALERLGNLEPVEERRKVALSSYKRFAQLLRKTAADDSLPDWMLQFQWRELYLDRSDVMVGLDEDLYVDDLPSISRHFVDESAVHFLAVPRADLPSLKRFLVAAEVPYLSSSYTSEFINPDDGIYEEALTSSLRQCVPYFVQIAHARDHDAFLVAQENGSIEALKSLEVCVAAEVKMRIALAGYERIVQEEIARTKHRIVFRKGTRLIEDKIGAQLCGYLGINSILAELFARVLLAGNSAKIEEFLDEKQIEKLPEDFSFGVEENIVDLHDDESKEVGQPVENETEALIDGAIVIGQFSERTEAVNATGEESSGIPKTIRPKELVEVVSVGQKTVRQNSPSVDSEGQTAKLAGLASGGLHSGERLKRLREGLNKWSESEASQLGNTSLTETEASTKSNAPDADGREHSPNEAPLDSPSKEGLQAHQHLKPSEQGAERGFNKSSPQPTVRGSGGKSRPSHRNRRSTRTGHLMSYVLLKDKSDDDGCEIDSAAALEKRATGASAVRFFMEYQANRWKSLTEMPELNPGFDVLALTHDGIEEFIEVKGQSDAWTERGVTLTPRELLEAERRRERYWLCVVEYVHDESRRRLYLFQDPFGLTSQFKFDSGWKAAAIAVNEAPLLPAAGRFVDVPNEGRGKIISVRPGTGKLYHLHVHFTASGKQKNLLFKPDKMTISEQ